MAMESISTAGLENGDSRVATDVQRLLRRATELWWASDTSLPPLGPAYSSREQAVREQHLERFLGSIVAELERQPRTPAEGLAVRERLSSAADLFARSALGLEEQHIDLLANSAFSRAGVRFVEAARQFDPGLSPDYIFQASRNAWTMNGLQFLLGLRVQLTPSILAYSLLYPYTDNYLDAPSVAAETKAALNGRLAQRLAGLTVAPANPHEQRIFDLVAMIEGQYRRRDSPQVFESLYAIHRAQSRSLGLLQGGAAPYQVDVLGLSLEKGGVSVLADGYLIAGCLTAAQSEFMFLWGAFLQLLDDLQDVASDRKAGLQTVFSQVAGRWPLDALTNRTLHFGATTLTGLDAFTAPGTEPLKELMRRSALLLTVDAAGRAGRLHSGRYVRELEARSPFRFAFVARCRARLARQRVPLLRLIERVADLTDGEE